MAHKKNTDRSKEKKDFFQVKISFSIGVGSINMKNLKKIYGFAKENKEKTAFKTPNPKKTQNFGVYGQKTPYLFANMLSTMNNSNQKLPKIHEKIIKGN